MIETSEAGTLITGKDVQTYFLVSLVPRLAMQAAGVRFHGTTPMIQAKTYSGSLKRTSLGVLEDYVSWLYANEVQLVHVEQTVLRALGPIRATKLGKRLVREALVRETSLSSTRG